MSSPAPIQTAHGPLADGIRTAVEDLGARAATADGVAALSEASLIGLGRADSRHVLLADADEESVLAGYAQVWVDGSAELAVAPGRRRQGLGTAVLAAAREVGAERFWAHGDLAAAAAAARAWGLAPVRELRHMTRPLTDADAEDVALPGGYVARPFVPGQDDAAWLRTNARAFAGHPEQGRVGQADLDALVAQPWFDPSGFFVVEEANADPTPEHRIAAFHWTKSEPGSEAGEVFVVGIDPDHQGRGLAGPLTRLGLAHLARRGLATVDLYVDGGNVRAVRTYERLGFTTDAVDVVYA